MALNGQKIVDLLCGLLSPADDTDKTRIVAGFQEHTKELHFPVTATTDLGVFKPNLNIVVTAVDLEPGGAVASDATIFWQAQLIHDDDAGGGDTAITNTLSSSVASFVANVTQPLVMATTGGVAVPSGKRVAIKFTKTGAAASFNGRVSVKYKEN